MSPARRARASGRRRDAAPAAREILGWEDDPLSGALPIRLPAPSMPPAKLRLAIVAKAPPLALHEPGTPGFRYWTAIESITRGISLWAPRMGERGWAATERLRIHLDRGRDLNAYYDRESLSFFHEEVAGTTIYSGESPDVVTHELGHAILDAIRPELWDVMSTEAAAFHESFGDLSAILAALEIPSVRSAVLEATGGKLFRSSRLSRLAESLGWAIRQSRPELVAEDCLRNAVNAFFYRPPGELPPSGPDATLSREPHSFSRVFTAGAFEALALAVAGAAKKPAERHLVEAARDLSTLLVEAVVRARIVPGYFAEIATRMLDADRDQLGARNAEALRTAFLRRGILSLDSTAAPPKPKAAGVRSRSSSGEAEGAGRAPRGRPAPGPRTQSPVALPLVAFEGASLGLGRRRLLLRIPVAPDAETPRGAAYRGGSVALVDPHDDARAFLEVLLRRGRIDLGAERGRLPASGVRPARRTHTLSRERGRLVVTRRFFDCGFDAP